MTLWAIVIYFTNTTNISIIENRFNSFIECKSYIQVHKDIYNIKNLSELKCEEITILKK